MAIFDVVVVGGGPAGEQAAGRLPDHGLTVAMVEDRLVGGECAHWACEIVKGLCCAPRGARRGAMHPATIAVGEIPLERVCHAVPPFLTRSELRLSLREQAGV